jgi:hypothetical protein
MGMYEEQYAAEKLGLERPREQKQCKCGGRQFGIKKVVKYGIDCIEPCDYDHADEIHCTNCNKIVKKDERTED